MDFVRDPGVGGLRFRYNESRSLLLRRRCDTMKVAHCYLDTPATL